MRVHLSCGYIAPTMAQITRRGVPAKTDSPYEEARKRLETLADPNALPKPPTEVVSLRSSRALEDWDDLMLMQDIELWGAVDLSVAAQLVCLQELARDLQFRVQTLGEMVDYNARAEKVPSIYFTQWHLTLNLITRLRANMGFSNTIGIEKTAREANRKAKRIARMGGEAVKMLMEQPAAQPKEPPLAGSDLTA